MIWELKTDTEKFFLKAIFASITFLVLSVLLLTPSYAEADETQTASDYIYLSDISYDEARTTPASTSASWGIISYDKTADTGAALSLKVDGQTMTFRKGIFAHATSTVVYDISNYNYDYFSTYYGVSSLRGSSGSVKFYISTSVDGNNWTLQTPADPQLMTGATNAGYIKVLLHDSGNKASDKVNYIKLYADCYQNNNGQDHSLYGDAKLFNEGYSENVTLTLEEYDEIIKAKYKGEITTDLELTLLQREFVKRTGSYTLRNFVEEDARNREVLDWLMNDKETLRLYLVGGKPEGSYLASLEVLSKLYYERGADMNITDKTQYGTCLGDLYRTMMLAISLTHSGKVYLWVDSSFSSDPVVRYDIYKDLHSQGLIECKIFESLTVEEMRWVMNTVIDDSEIKWLNDYVRNDKNGATSPYSYIRYTFGYNYYLDKYYSQENYAQWDEKYHLKEWHVPYESGHPKLWVVFEEGSVCGGLSKTGSCIWGAYKGLPNTCVCQPRHCAYIYYTQNANGDGVWNLGNDVSGWSLSGKTEHLNVRIMNDWGSSEPGWTATYVLLAQAAQNEYDKYEASEITLMLADVYKDDSKTLEDLYRKALTEEKINYDAWEGLVNLYLSESKSEEACLALATDIADALTYYPHPMHILLSKLDGKISSAKFQASFDMLETRTLKTALNATSNESIQWQAVRSLANALLGNMDTNVATFSFDGADAGKIMLGSKYAGSDVAWDYSLDGGTTWTQVTAPSQQLTEAEFASITSTNDIKVHIIGVDYSEANIFTIDITESAGIPATVYANDLENALIAATDAMEWRFSDTESWTSFATSKPDLTGYKTVTVRVAATGTCLASTTSTPYTFTKDNTSDKRKYIPVSNLSVHQFSSEQANQGEYAVNFIDGNLNTMWHSAWNGSDAARTITVKLNEAKYISAIEYVPRQDAQNGRVKDGNVMLSVDGVTWYTASEFTNWANDKTTKTIELGIPVKAQYVKFTATANYGGGSFISGCMLNLFEDTTYHPVARFSFDGENAGTVSLLDEYAGTQWRYSLDGGATWKDATGNSQHLTQEEIDSITAENNIKVSFNNETNTYDIDILEQPSPELGGYRNDWEDRMIGIGDTTGIEWKIEGDAATSTWKLYKDEEPIVTGNSKLLVRRVATGIYAPSAPTEYQFKADEYDATQVYVPIANLSIADKSSETNDNGGTRLELASYAIDGNINTMWHTVHDGTDKQNYITIKLNRPMHISALQYIPKPSYQYGVMKNGVVSVSTDGENWTQAATISGCVKDYTPIMIPFTQPIQAQYVKLQVTSHDNVFTSAALINLFHDSTKEAHAVTEISYSTMKPTNGSVTASLVCLDGEVKVTNNNGSTEHTFHDNGWFTFEYIDGNGHHGSLTAGVDWIDKKAPVGRIVYSDENATSRDVTATLVCDEQTTVSNNEGLYTYVFTENGSFEFEFRDAAGNIGRATANVTWINKSAPVGEITYSTTSLTNGNVTATLTVGSDIKILEPKVEEDISELAGEAANQASYTFTENDSFVFIFQDENENVGSEVAEVTWIDKQAPVGSVSYEANTEMGTVTATLTCDEPVIMLNSDKSYTYTFTENGTYEFTYRDWAGNEGTTTAEVTWIGNIGVQEEPAEPKDPGGASDEPGDPSVDPGDTNDPSGGASGTEEPATTTPGSSGEGGNTENPASSDESGKSGDISDPEESGKSDDSKEPGSSDDPGTPGEPGNPYPPEKDPNGKGDPPSGGKEYKVIDGHDSVFEKGGGNAEDGADGSALRQPVIIRIDGDFDKFEEVYVDGKLVSKECYSAVAGSTIITFKEEYLETLSVGEHKVTVEYTDGTANTTFTIKDNTSGNGLTSEEPTTSGTGNGEPNDDNSALKDDGAGKYVAAKTGDDVKYWPLVAMMLLASGALLVCFVIQLRQRR